MANVAEHWGSAGADGPFAVDLLNPVALEARLVEARARRSRALAEERCRAWAARCAPRCAGSGPALRRARLARRPADLSCGPRGRCCYDGVLRPRGSACGSAGPAPRASRRRARPASRRRAARVAAWRGSIFRHSYRRARRPWLQVAAGIRGAVFTRGRPVPSRRCYRLEIPHGGCAGLGFGVDPRRPDFRRGSIIRATAVLHPPTDRNGPAVRPARPVPSYDTPDEPPPSTAGPSRPRKADRAERPRPPKQPDARPRAFAEAYQDKGTSWPRRRAAWQRMGTRPRSVEPACSGAGPIRTRLLRQGRAARQLRQGRVARQRRKGGRTATPARAGRTETPARAVPTATPARAAPMATPATAAVRAANTDPLRLARTRGGNDSWRAHQRSARAKRQRLVAVDTPVAESVILHASDQTEGVSRMTHLETLELRQDRS